MIRVISIVALFFATASSAQDHPALYDVTGVSPTDGLNVRAGPSTEEQIIGELPPDARDVEVIQLSPNEGWAQINFSETAGWVSVLYLQRNSPDMLFPPKFLRCFGTEPFWSLQVSMSETPMAVFRLPDTNPERIRLKNPSQSANLTDRFSIVGEDGSGNAVLTVQRELCSDGMSDQKYGLSVELVRTAKQPAHLSGCCSIAP